MTSTSSNPPIRLEFLDPPQRLWAFEPNHLPVRLTNHGCEELTRQRADAQVEGTVDLMDANGQFRRRLVTIPLEASLPVGQSIHYDLHVEIHDLAGDYHIELGIQISRVGAETKAVVVDSSPHRFALKYTIFDAFMELINVCNFKCTFCPQPTMIRKPREMDFGLAEKIVKDLQAMDHHHPIRVHLLGEPLLHKRFLDIVEMTHDHGQRLLLATNGSRFDRATVDGIIRVGLDELLISLNTPEEESYYAQRGTDMTYAEYIASIERMIVAVVENPERAPKTRLSVLYEVGELNTKVHRTKTTDVANQWIDVIRRVTGQHIPRLEDCVDLDPCVTTLLPLTEKLELQWVVYHQWGEGGQPENRFCGMPWRQLPILVDGQASACNADAQGEIHLGNVNEQTVEEIWNGKPLQDLRAGFMKSDSVHSRCQRCENSDDLERFFPA